jgi:hypothetical protein
VRVTFQGVTVIPGACTTSYCEIINSTFDCVQNAYNPCVWEWNHYPTESEPWQGYVAVSIGGTEAVVNGAFDDICTDGPRRLRFTFTRPIDAGPIDCKAVLSSSAWTIFDPAQWGNCNIDGLTCETTAA